MSFVSGKFGVRKLNIVGALNVVGFLTHASNQRLPPLSEVSGGEEAVGWAGSNGLLDQELPMENGQWIRLNLVVAKRVYPSKRLEADFQEAVSRWKKENHAVFMQRQVAAQLKEDLKNGALSDAPVGVDGVQVVIDVVNGVIYTDALSDAWVDRLMGFLSAVGVQTYPVSVESICERGGVSLSNAQPLNIGDAGQIEMFADALAREFLTWLWMMGERAGQISLDGRTPVDVLVDGPLVLQTTGYGAVVRKVTLDGERTTRGRETARALLSNKLLTKAKVMLSPKTDRVIDLTLCADDLLLKGVKLPDCESVNMEDQVEERLEMCAELFDLVEALVARYANDRGDGMERDLREWVASKGREGASAVDADESHLPAYPVAPKESPSMDLMDDEGLIQQAIEVIRAMKRASTPLLQRRLRIGYNRAATLIELLEARGIIGPPSSEGGREVLINMDEETAK